MVALSCRLMTGCGVFAGTKPCEYWARAQAANVLLAMKMYGAAYAILSQLVAPTADADAAGWDGISFHILGRQEGSDGAFFRKGALNEWASLQMGLGEAQSAMPFFRQFSDMNTVRLLGLSSSSGC